MIITNDTIQFLMENKIQNSREWYQSHKEDYRKHVLRPMMELVDRMAPAMCEIDPEFIMEPKVDKTISRIYRDTRFSNDKSLYREVVWCVFSRDKKRYTLPPGFFFEFSPYGFRYGCGWFSAPPEAMERLRRLVIDGDKSFLAAKKAFQKQTVFAMAGDVYKRQRFPTQPPELQEWLNRKGIAFLHNSEDFDSLFSEDLPEKLTADFALLKPIYAFLCKVNGY